MPDATNPGESRVSKRMLESVYTELRALARRYLGGASAGQTLQPTALVHEAWLKLQRPGSSPWTSRTHFVAAAAVTMRHVLVNHLKSRSAIKRGGGWTRVDLDDVIELYQGRCVDLLALDEALNQLGELDPRQARIVELRFFGGLTIEETADALDVSSRTVEREWRIARAWLRTRLDPQPDGPAS